MSNKNVVISNSPFASLKIKYGLRGGFGQTNYSIKAPFMEE
jgi:hypothetical protein